MSKVEKLYKLTDRLFQTNALGESGKRFEVQWRVGDWCFPAQPSETPKLCSPTVLHAFRTKTAALVWAGIHRGYLQNILSEAEGEVVVSDYQKVGCSKLRILKPLTADDKHMEEVLYYHARLVRQHSWQGAWIKTVEHFENV